jgi:HAD superfamily phosphoserine phosphatase-like hydrolase
MIVASDLEGTLSAGETWRGIRAYLEAHGRKADYSRFMRGKMPLYLGAKLGLVNKRRFQNRWIEDLPGLFAGHSLESFQAVAAWVVQHELRPKLRQNVLNELEAARQSGARVILASGTYQPVLRDLAQTLGFEAIGTPLRVVNGLLTGKLDGPVNVEQIKRSSLLSILEGAALNRAYGDTLADVPMLEAAQEAVVVAGNDARLERLAITRGWRVLR